jgi:hypothetical protein
MSTIRRSRTWGRGLRPAGFVFCATVLTAAVASHAGESATSRTYTGCPRLSEAASLPVRTAGGRLRGDIDGDRRLDRVTIRYAASARASCGFVLMVRTARRIVSATLPEWYKPPDDPLIRDWPFPEPYLAAIVQLDAHRSQVVVARWHGASVAVVALYGLAGGRLVPLRFHPRTYRDTLSLFGTVGTGSTYARCVRGGPLIVIGLWPRDSSGEHWAVSRSTYRLAGASLWRTRTRKVEGSRRRIESLAHRWGVDAAPFTRCVVERGRRL